MAPERPAAYTPPSAAPPAPGEFSPPPSGPPRHPGSGQRIRPPAGSGAYRATPASRQGITNAVVVHVSPSHTRWSSRAASSPAVTEMADDSHTAGRISKGVRSRRPPAPRPPWWAAAAATPCSAPPGGTARRRRCRRFPGPCAGPLGCPGAWPHCPDPADWRDTLADTAARGLRVPAGLGRSHRRAGRSSAASFSERPRGT